MTNPSRRFLVLVVDDDDIITRYLQASLRSAGWATVVARNGLEALALQETERPDLVILDLMMPSLNGFEVCRLLRERTHTPIIVLSVCNEPCDKVKALRLGADDYLVKPFSLEELTARMSSVLRRVRAGVDAPIEPRKSLGNLSVDLATQTIHSMDSISSHLTPTEYALLEEFLDNPDKVLTHSRLLNRVWGSSHSHSKEYLHVFVNRLRGKIEPEPHNPRFIITVHGIGYLFRKEPVEADVQASPQAA
ncbi:MAG: response regulator transcription factor [Dehalococcoidia bacterium]|nr:response regulator transcription factor [Dehalococcoidia bacterium]